MNFSEFLNLFYIQGKQVIKGYKSQKKIPLFFVKHSLIDEYNDNIINPSESTYERWFSGSRQPETQFWEEMKISFDTEKLYKALMLYLNDDYLGLLAERFGLTLEKEERLEKNLLAKSISNQFKAIVWGFGNAHNNIQEAYRKPPEIEGYNNYLREAVYKYQWIKFPKGGEVLLQNYYVCNNIGTSSVAFPGRTKQKCIENATLTKLRKRDNRTLTPNSIIIGASGYGKSLLLQHLFLDAVENIKDTGILPIIGQLRNYSSVHDDLVSFIAEAAHEIDRHFNKDALIDLLEKGQVAILLDGLDEMNTHETGAFQRNLTELLQHYPNNQIIISSRQCSGINGIRRFDKLYIHPLSQEQGRLLIDRLLQNEDEEVKNKILSYVDSPNGLFKTKSFIATNPMLLTLIVTNHEYLGKSKTEFYKLMYDTLTVKHDDEKESYERLFYSVANSDDFKSAFREFCGLAYVDGIDQFSDIEFERYFNMLKCKSSFENSSKFRVSQFKQDVCATACMMYEQETKVFYIDNGFQDYFFAEYYYLEDSESTKSMGQSIISRDIDSFRNLDALKMLYSFAPEKVQSFIILPFLKCIFKAKSDKEAFLRFLSLGYDHVNYILLSKPTVDKYIQNTALLDCTLIQNHICNIIMWLICDVYNLSDSFVIDSLDELVMSDVNATHNLFGFFEDKNYEGQKRRFLKTIEYPIEKSDVAYANNVVKENDVPICFGYIYKVNPLSLKIDSDEYKQFVELFEQSGMIPVFNRLKEIYTELCEKQKRMEYR